MNICPSGRLAAIAKKRLIIQENIGLPTYKRECTITGTLNPPAKESVPPLSVSIAIMNNNIAQYIFKITL